VDLVVEEQSITAEVGLPVADRRDAEDRGKII
jgi:hypothetical protein